MNAPSSDVLIIGGGVIGLCTAWNLARRGAHVTVLDAGRPGQASWAAAGMLAPLAETGKPGPFVETALQSLAAYPALLSRLREETGSDLDLAGPGTLRVAVSDEEEDALCQARAWQKDTGLPLEWLDGPSVRRLEPSLSPTVQAALLSPDEKHVTPRRLLGALTQACLRRRISLLPGTTVTGLVVSGERVIAVQTPNSELSCGALLVAGGAWAGALGDWLDVHFPIVPVRGQVLALQSGPSAPIRHTIYGHSRYLVPRAGGQIVVGATEEHVGFDTGTTAAGVESLLSAAAALVPALSAAPVESVWSGLRPVSADGLPLLGRVPGWQNVHVATGHGRNGILLTPLTGKFMAEHILDATPPPPAFDPARFASTS